MQCILRARIAAPPVAALAPKRRNEQCNLEIQDRQTLSATFLYLGDIYMGRVGDGAGEINLDERRLPPGKYNCQMVAQNNDGVLLPGMSKEYVVPNRYTIACADTSPTIVIPEHDPDAKLMVKVQHTPGLSITKTRVYIAGNFAGEKEGDEFTLGMPLQNVPTGVNTIEVIGIGPDNITYPVESIAVKIKNDPWEQRTYNTPEYLRIADSLPRIKEQERLVGYWLERAAYEPDKVLVSSTVTHYHTYTEITEQYAPGNRAEYKANAKNAFILLTQLQLEAGRLYHKLQMRTRAKNMLYRVVQELGTHTPDGVEAAAELQALKKERLTTL